MSVPPTRDWPKDEFAIAFVAAIEHPVRISFRDAFADEVDRWWAALARFLGVSRARVTQVLNRLKDLADGDTRSA